MTSARDELSAVNELLGEATAARNAAQQAYDRLEKPAALLDEAVEALAVEESVYKAELVAWYSNGCIGLRPAVPPSLEAAERRVGENAQYALGESVGCGCRAERRARRRLSSVRLGRKIRNCDKEQRKNKCQLSPGLEHAGSLRQNQ